MNEPSSGWLCNVCGKRFHGDWHECEGSNKNLLERVQKLESEIEKIIQALLKFAKS